jgi:hypothetical protein
VKERDDVELVKQLIDKHINNHIYLETLHINLTSSRILIKNLEEKTSWDSNWRYIAELRLRNKQMMYYLHDKIPTICSEPKRCINWWREQWDEDCKVEAEAKAASEAEVKSRKFDLYSARASAERIGV